MTVCIACEQEVPTGKIACSFHWSLVSKETKIRVYALAEEGVRRDAPLWIEWTRQAEIEARAGDQRKKK